MSKAISRRDFLKVSGAVGAAGLLAACGGNSASSGAAPAASGSEETSTVASTPETKHPVTLTVYIGGTSPNLSTCRR